ncbi:hypothetical protein JAAARDRAFT_34411 [Jaapia argillacea MUCL 33604]|uniref:F-box domain-containing protein n=1 Tax=Jaapia argillacea MUCL 33604 TaxID=933084 RepID=A0A067PV46_9AGAM|nr:hypothetical protein JAAARDRAFT_34411 [Jaapia argillacea MUCL 33604]
MVGLTSHLTSAVLQIEQLVLSLKRLTSEYATLEQGESNQLIQAEKLLEVSRLLRRVGSQDVAIGFLETALDMVRGQDSNVAKALAEEIAEQRKESLALKRLRCGFDRLPSDILVLVCGLFEPGGSDLFFVSRVCQSWRNTIISTPKFWRRLKVSKFDKNPGLKAAAFVQRAGVSGLTHIDLDMTFDWDKPEARPKRVCARNDRKSTFQTILHAIDKYTKKGVVHNLEEFRYFSQGPWHGFDMTYLIRFLIRPYIQPRVVHLITEDTCDFGWYNAIPILPCWNPRLAEFLIRGRAVVHYCFSTDTTIPVISRLDSLKMCHIGIGRSSPLDPDGDVGKILHGLVRAVQVRQKYEQKHLGPPLTYEPCEPGVVDKAHARVDMIMDGWTTAPRHGFREAADPKSPPIVLPGLRELILGVDSFEILRRLELPAIEALIVANPLYLHWDDNLATPNEQLFVDQLARFGDHLKTLSITYTGLGEALLLGHLHELCPSLERLCVGRNAKVTFKTIISYLQKKAAHPSGTRTLKLLDCREQRATEEETAFIRGVVDNYWDGWGSRAWVYDAHREDLSLDRYEKPRRINRRGWIDDDEDDEDDYSDSDEYSDE